MDEIDPLDKLRRLYVQLVARRHPIHKLESYYDGAHPLAFAGPEFLEAFGGLFRAFADNWCGIVVNAVDERLKVEGFRVGDDPNADDTAKRLWEVNDLDTQSGMGHTSGLTAGAFYVVVWPSDTENVPEITVESATGTIVECHPKIRRRRTAALRTWMDDDGYEHAELFLPDRVYCYRSKGKRTGVLTAPNRSSWMIDDHPDVRDKLDESGSMSNPFAPTIPVVEFLNSPRLHVSRQVGWFAHSELSSIIPLQDATNKLVADMLVASEFAAYPQRHLVGYEADEDEETGATIQPKFENGPGKVWWLEDTDAKFGQFEAANLAAYVTAVEMMVQHIASLSSTPPHYLRASADRLSGESLKSAETGLVAKVRRKMTTLGAGWEEVMRLAGKVAEAPELANAVQMETIWRDPETRTESEHVDAVVKKQALNVPDPQLWEELGYSPEQVARFPAMRAESEISGMAAAAALRAEQAIAPPSTPPNPTEV